MLVELDLIPVRVYLEIELKIATVFSHGLRLKKVLVVTGRQELIILRSVQMLMKSELSSKLLS